ncbi:EAL domain-containing protein [Aliikangiella sp. IMCC44359]|uniref:EAL domain-containing protein n=1 Tax=Aliikangiella sp. IMCC44359 TaxID=3459125 RepID=UPI00403AD472
MEQKLSKDELILSHSFPTSKATWQKMAEDCIALANHNGGIIQLFIPENTYHKRYFKTFSKNITQFTQGLKYVYLKPNQSTSVNQLKLKVYPSSASLISSLPTINNNLSKHTVISQMEKPNTPTIQIQELQQADIPTDLIQLKYGIQHSPYPILMLDKNNKITMANKAFQRLVTANNDDLLNQPITSFLTNKQTKSSFKQIWQYVNTGQVWQGTIDFQGAPRDSIPVELAVTPILNSQNKPESYLLQLKDLRESIATQQQLKQLAFYDPVTNLANRALLKDRLSMALASQRRQNTYGALLFIDLDHFKQINDVHGHSQGDAVLKECAIRLSSILREDDTLARIGGDEFVAILLGFGSSSQSAKIQATSTAEKLLGSMNEPLIVNGYQHYIGASIGVTIFPKGLETAEDLLREADTAMYGAKSAGRNSVLLFESSMFQAVRQRYQIEHELREAIENNQFEIYLQPQVDIDEQIVASEALLRWQHPTNGLILPAKFIPIAEDTGQIVAIGNWVLVKVCEVIADCQQQGKGISIAANVSAHQFREPDFVSTVKHILKTTQASPSLLTLELTESLLLEDTTATAKIMSELAALGINFSIDDFGTGYSNLGYLKKLPLKELKIDQSFIRDICIDPNDAAVVETMLSLAKHLNLQVVAEGVENKEQAEFLNKLARIKMQGYLFSKPQPVTDFLALWLNKPLTSERHFE